MSATVEKSFGPYNARLLRIVDGDTLKVSLDLGFHVTLEDVSVRIASINAPELKTPEGAAALKFALSLLEPGAELTIVSHSVDKYGRVLGSVSFVDAAGARRDFGMAMVDAGHAVSWDGRGAKP